MSELLRRFSLIDWALLFGYFGLMFYIGHSTGKKKTDAEGYFLGQRQMPTWMVAFSIVATSLSVATFVGVPQLSYTGDLTYISLNIGGFLAVFIVASLFIPRLYRAGTITIYGYLENRFGETAKIATSVMFLIGRLLASGARLFIAAIPVCLLLFGSFEPTKFQLISAIVLIGALGTAYTVAGGIKAVIWTDTIQLCIVMGTTLLTIGLLLHKIPAPMSAIWHAWTSPGAGPHGSKLKLVDFSTDMARPFTFWTALIGSTFLSTAAAGVDQDLAQRMLTAKSALRGSLSLIASQFLSVAVVSLFLVIGLLLYIFYGRPDLMGAAAPTDPMRTSQQVYPQFLLYHLPAGLRGLAIAGMFAAAQGSLDSAINAMASSAVADLYWPLRRRMGLAIDTSHQSKSPRLAVLAMGIILVLFAVMSAFRYDAKNDTLINFALGVMSFAFTGMLGVFLTALLTRRGNSATVLAALIAGVVVTTLLQDSVLGPITQHLFHRRYTIATFWWMPIGTLITFLICFSGRGASQRSEAGTRAAREAASGPVWN
jgi:SSS family transporter